MMTVDMQTGFALVRSLIDNLEKLAETDHAAVEVKLIQVTSILLERPPAKAGHPARGYGFDKDEAMIMAFRHEHGGSIERSARAHWAGEDEDWIDAKIRRLYRRKREIDGIGQGTDF